MFYHVLVGSTMKNLATMDKLVDDIYIWRCRVEVRQFFRRFFPEIATLTPGGARHPGRVRVDRSRLELEEGQGVLPQDPRFHVRSRGHARPVRQGSILRNSISHENVFDNFWTTSPNI
jgi:hypothetical protein